jgi:hypothetical protein
MTNKKTIYEMSHNKSLILPDNYQGDMFNGESHLTYL